MEIEELKEKYGKSNPKAPMGFIEKIKKVILSPNEFFDAIKTEEGITQAFIYYAILSLIYSILFGIFYFLMPTFLGPMPFGELGIAMIVISYVVGLISVFIYAVITHIFTKIVGGNGNYSATFKSLVYASTPSLLLGWVPMIGVIFAIFSLYLMIKGISKLHGITMLRAFVAVFIIPLIIGIVIAMIVGALFTPLTSLGPTGSFLQILRPFV